MADRDGEQAGGSAGDAVKRYLEALARGDAETALSYGIDQPATSEFLTSEILKKQVAQWPIRNIRILHDNSSAPDTKLSMAHVHVVAVATAWDISVCGGRGCSVSRWRRWSDAGRGSRN